MLKYFISSFHTYTFLINFLLCNLCFRFQIVMMHCKNIFWLSLIDTSIYTALRIITVDYMSPISAVSWPYFTTWTSNLPSNVCFKILFKIIILRQHIMTKKYPYFFPSSCVKRTTDFFTHKVLKVLWKKRRKGFYMALVTRWEYLLVQLLNNLN